jgi:dsRNA-specific ribonuclease
MVYDLLQPGELNIILEAVNAFLGAVFGRQNSTIILKMLLELWKRPRSQMTSLDKLLGIELCKMFAVWMHLHHE